MDIKTMCKFLDMSRVQKIADSNNVRVHFYPHRDGSLRPTIIIGRKQLVRLLEKIESKLSPTVAPAAHALAKTNAADARSHLWPKSLQRKDTTTMIKPRKFNSSQPTNIARDGAAKKFVVANRENGISEVFPHSPAIPTATKIPGAGHPDKTLSEPIHPSMAFAGGAPVDDGKFTPTPVVDTILVQREHPAGRGGVHKDARLPDKLGSKA